MQATRIAQARGADEALLVRPDGIVLEAADLHDLLGLAEGGLRTPSIGVRHPRVDHPGAHHQGASRRGGRVPAGRPARDPRGVPGLDRARGPARARRSTASARDPRPQDARGAPRRSRRSLEASARRGLGCTAVDLDLTDEQRLISETARDFTDNEIIPRARENDRDVSGSTSSSPAGSATWDISAPRSPRSTAAEALDYVSYGLIVEQIGRGDSSCPDRRLGPDLARLRLDRALGHGGAEAALAAAAVRRRGFRLLRADRARRRLRSRRRCARAR